MTTYSWVFLAAQNHDMDCNVARFCPVCMLHVVDRPLATATRVTPTIADRTRARTESFSALLAARLALAVNSLTL